MAAPTGFRVVEEHSSDDEEQAKKPGWNMMRGRGRNEFRVLTGQLPPGVEGRRDHFARDPGARVRGELHDNRALPARLEPGLRTETKGKTQAEGGTGRAINLTANYYKFNQPDTYTFYQYRVDFEPDTDAYVMRKHYFKLAVKAEHQNVGFIYSKYLILVQFVSFSKMVDFIKTATQLFIHAINDCRFRELILENT
jgi:hypothetical protein